VSPACPLWFPPFSKRKKAAAQPGSGLNPAFEDSNYRPTTRPKPLPGSGIEVIMVVIIDPVRLVIKRSIVR
jgi:hypothetical protein